MTKDSGTRSGLLWEVERLLGEMTERPQILLMENVPQVVGSTGIKDFAKWIERLEQFGYKNYWQLLNAKDYGIPQNRNRCFMVSLLGDYIYHFPKKQSLNVRLKDFLDKEVDEKYYLSDKTIEMFIEHTKKQQAKGNGFKFEPTNGDGYAKTISTRAVQRTDDNFIAEPMVWDGFNQQVRADSTVCGTITRNAGADLKRNGQGIIEPIALDEQNGYLRQDGCVGTLTTDGNSPKHNNRILEPNYRVRKLTERECGKLMGVKVEDVNKLGKRLSKSAQYHCFGDSIVTTVLMAIFGELLNIDYESKIKETSDELAKSK